MIDVDRISACIADLQRWRDVRERLTQRNLQRKQVDKRTVLVAWKITTLQWTGFIDGAILVFMTRDFRKTLRHFKRTSDELLQIRSEIWDDIRKLEQDGK